jgi:hypothetical protein
MLAPGGRWRYVARHEDLVDTVASTLLPLVTDPR